MHRRFVPVALILLGAFAAVDVSPAEPNADVAKHVARVVAGILSYAHWPTPVDTYQFCTAGEVAYLYDGWKILGQSTSDPVSVRKLTFGESNWVTNCDVLYLGGMTPDRRGSLLAEAIGQPVLTISEGDGVCASSSMFCLTVQGGDVSLLANLDAISRSAVKINPRVLQLVHRKQDRKGEK
ncbi:MAG: YfiR family protein [Azonexus sp.]|uniref:YfiR family protein n=1 Tax=Azonexus sp. TaxID=1872668 RepID=UPI0028336DAC|nr:YfiR family protein [Azonexus sp.]MDR0777541.1 YfiR family protein [Azonexus sp.]